MNVLGCLCIAANCHFSCPLWVKSRHIQRKTSCPLYPKQRPRKRTSPSGTRRVCPIIVSTARFSASLFKLNTAGGAQFLDVLDHACGDPRHVGNLIAAEFECILFTGPSLLGRAFGLRFSSKCDGHYSDNCDGCEIRGHFCHGDLPT